MSSYDSELFNVSPYYDDFSDDKRFLRMLFRPGYAVQSRELTQLQTILQNQIEKFGDHIFKDGSVIIGGQISTQTLNYVRIQPQSIQTSTAPVSKTLTSEDLVGYSLIQRDAEGNVVARAKVIDFLPAYSSSDNYGIAIIVYMSGDEFTAGATLETDGPTLLYTTAATTVSFKGKANVVAIAEGIFYINGFFVRTDNQIQPAYTVSNEIRQFATPTGSMGFSVTPVIVTERDDYTLRDPANGSYNYNAPGSHRYRVDLNLIFVENADQSGFFELVRYQNGEVIKKFDKTQYPELVKLFAQRTQDQSGNYIVKPFSVSMREIGGTTLVAEIGAGKAYVYGYEYESSFKDQVEIPKARTTASYQGIETQNRFDNYVLGKYRSQLPNGQGISHTNMVPLFNGIDLDGNPGSRPILVYGMTGAALGTAAYLANGFSGAVFTALLHRMEFNYPNNNDTVFPLGAAGNTGVYMKAYLSSIDVLREPISTAPNAKLNLYSINPVDGRSTRVLFDLDTIRDAFPETLSLLPQINNFNNQDLVYPLNGSNQTTLIQSNEKISYVHTVYRSFQVVPSANTPAVGVDLSDSSFKWCTAEGAIPGANEEFPIDEGDEYYLVYTATNTQSSSGTPQNLNPPLLGEVLRLRLTGGSRNVGDYIVDYPTAKITANGAYIQFTTPLYPGQYTLVGKVKADQQNVLSNTAQKIRTKTLKTDGNETITSSSIGKRVINNGSKFVANTEIFSVYFTLNKADVYKIDTIVDASNNNADISYKFEFDSGQREGVYGLGRLYVKPKYLSEFANKSLQQEPTFNFKVTYSYFDHAGYGPFIKESYTNSGISYENIPVFVNPRNGNSINLVNAIDFRPVETIIGYRQSGSATLSSDGNGVPVLTYEGGFIPDNYTIESDYTAYLPRIDKIVISKNISADEETTTIRRVAGVPGDSPKIPEDLNESMTLSILSVPAYTFNAEDVKSQNVANNRFTVKDIATMSKRVDDLEQHVVLTDIETNALYRDIKNSQGEDAIKRAVLVDSFNGHSIGDVLNPDYRCSIDIERGELKPSFDSHALGVEYIDNDAGITLTSDNILCEVFSRHATPIVEQAKASSKTAVNTFGFPNWVGNMTVTPHGDFWFDRDFRPTVKQNQDGINDAWVAAIADGLNGHGTQWNDWESLWTGVSVEQTDIESKKNAEFFGRSREKNDFYLIDRKFFNKEGIVREADVVGANRKIYHVDFRKKEYYTLVSTDTLINNSVVPYVRDQVVVFNAYNMKPGTTVHIFVDNVDMTDICYRYDESGATLDLLASATGPFVTDELNGSLTNVVLTIPRGIFEAGEKLIRVIDDANNDIENATTVAECVFYCTGIKGQNPLDIQSIRYPEIRKQTPNSNKVVSTPLYRSKSINTIKYNNWTDPMAQTFEISQSLYPSGLFAESVDVFIASADEDLPITLQICPVVGGIPHTTVSLPFSTVIKNPSEVSVDSETPVATTFKFSSPVFLAPGEYAITLSTNSALYSVYTAKIGEKDLTTDERISATLSTGSLFKSQNNSETIGENKTDLMFKLYRCQFQTTANGTRTVSIQTAVDGDDDSVEDITYVQPNLFVFTPDDVSMSGMLEAGSPSRTYSFTNSRSIPLAETLGEITTAAPVTFDLTVQNNSGGINTFMIDMDKTNLITVSYIIRASPEIVSEETPFAFKPRRRRRRRAVLGISNTRKLKDKALPIIKLGDRPLPGGYADGVVGSGLSKRGRKKWRYGLKSIVPQYIANSLEDLSVAGVTEDENARYITRFVTIPNGVTAKELKVYFDANLPLGTSVNVYAKAFNTTIFSQNADVQAYRKMTEESTSLFQSLDNTANEYSIDENDFREASYSLVTPIDFNTFCVKICMYTTNKAKIPTIKNLRVVAIE